MSVFPKKINIKSYFFPFSEKKQKTKEINPRKTNKQATAKEKRKTNEQFLTHR